MGSLVYILCSFTGTLCAFLLLRRYFHTKTRLLLWSGVCFSLLAAANVILYIDLHVVPDIDLALIRSSITSLGALILLFGLIWETI